jgi:hypothetical protein
MTVHEDIAIDLDDFALPEAPALPAPFERLATEKQVGFIASLLREHALPQPWKPADVAIDALPRMSRENASDLITDLLAAPRAPRTDSAGAALEPGFYQKDEGIYRVVRSQGTGGLYAKRLTDTGWEYEQGLIGSLAGAVRLTVEVAAAYGRRTGTCAICYRTLTVAESIERGIGPVCAGRLA